MLLLLLFLAAPGCAASSPYQLNAEAVEEYKQGHYPEAEAGFRRALEAWGQVAHPVERDRAVASLNLGTVLRIEGRYQDAQIFIDESLQQLEAAAGPDSLDVARAASGLAALYQAWGRPAAAEPLATRAARIFATHPGATESDRLNGQLLLASVYLDHKRNEAAEPLLAELRNRADSRALVRGYNDLAAAAIRRDDLDRAESLVRRSLEIAGRILPANDLLRAAALNNLAQICRFQQRYMEAEQHYHDAIAIWEVALGPRHPDTARGLLNLAALHHERGREGVAEDLYRRAAAIFHDAYGDGHELTLVARAELAEVLRAERRYSESERLTLSTLPVLETRFGTGDPRVIRALENYRRLLDQTRN
jgi:tetratricopeptide (TPR) repeat protein